MEPLGAFPDGEWDCFPGMFATEDFNYSPGFLAQNSLLLGEGDDIKTQSMFLPAPEAGENQSMFYSFDALDSNLQYISQESSYNSNYSGETLLIDNPGLANFYLSDCDHASANTACMSMNFHMMDEINTISLDPSLANIVMEDAVSLTEDRSSDRLENSNNRLVEPAVVPAKQVRLKRKLVVSELVEVPPEDKGNYNSSEIQKKKPRVTRDMQEYEKNARPKKNQKHSQNENGNEEEETNTRLDGQSSSSYSLDDDNASQQNSGGETSGSKSPTALNLNGKTRASRRTATDPQSLYARKRRERINERLRVLQNLVPSGTKVDISTMLEEAVHYVKFLQLQIKLLSSDDLWMYAPIAYNGMDIGFNLSRKISQTS